MCLMTRDYDSTVTIAYCFSLQEQYIFCHDTLADFLDSFDTYANFKDLGNGRP